MDEKYDAIVLGTGFKECIISGLLSVEGMKVKALRVAMCRPTWDSDTSVESPLHLCMPNYSAGAAYGQEQLLRWGFSFPQLDTGKLPGHPLQGFASIQTRQGCSEIVSALLAC